MKKFNPDCFDNEIFYLDKLTLLARKEGMLKPFEHCDEEDVVHFQWANCTISCFAGTARAWIENAEVKID